MIPFWSEADNIRYMAKFREYIDMSNMGDDEKAFASDPVFIPTAIADAEKRIDEALRELRKDHGKQENQGGTEACD